MEERRRDKRLDLLTSTTIKLIGAPGKEELVGIEIFDVSKKGVGFYYDKPLEICSLYEGELTLWTKEVIHAFFEIVRIEKLENTFQYGALFIGMPDTATSGIDIYRTVQESQSVE